MDDDISRLLVASESAEIESLAMGVQQIWVRDEYRRRGVARQLVDAARREFVCGGVKKSSVAFSQPTAAGRQFAFSYIKKPFILAYGK